MSHTPAVNDRCTPLARLRDVAAWLGQAPGAADADVWRIHTDTRTLTAGDLFVALKGETFDANAFLAQAQALGAVAAVCQGPQAQAELARLGLPGWVVPDTRAALAQMARAHRARWQLPLVAVTGSNGKTTVTQMVAGIFRAWHGEAALATAGNLNNDIGVPLTVLRLRPHHRVAVVELGMNHPGEIAHLAAIAQPTVALVNNAQREHLEFMHTVDAVAQENGAVLSALPPHGVAVFPAGDAYTALWERLAGQRPCLRFAASGPGQAEVAATGAQWQGDAWSVQVRTPAGLLALRLHIAGAHNVTNALAACACALAAGAPLPAIEQGLSAFRPVSGRSRALALVCAGRPLTLVDDSYNANPDSVRAAIDVLAGLPGPRLLVLGDMGEVGDQGPAFHAEAGAHAQAAGIEQVVCLGTLTAHTVAACAGAAHFARLEDLLAAVHQTLPQVASVLVKGSRFMRMERVVQAIEAACAAHNPETAAC